MARRKWGDDVKQAAIDLAAENYTLRQIEAEIGVPYQTLHNWGIKAHDEAQYPVMLPVAREKGQKFTDADKIEIYNMLNGYRMSIEEIATHYDAHRTTISRLVTNMDDPVIATMHREQMRLVIMQGRSGLSGLLTRTFNAPIPNARDGGIAFKSIVEGLVMIEHGANNVTADAGTKKTMADLMRSYREEKEAMQQAARGAVVDSTAY